MRELINIIMAIYYARKIQTFLWGKPGAPTCGRTYTYEDWIELMEKRTKRLRVITTDNQSWSVEARKRSLQLAGLAIAFITAINRGKIIPKV